MKAWVQEKLKLEREQMCRVQGAVMALEATLKEIEDGERAAQQRGTDKQASDVCEKGAQPASGGTACGEGAVSGEGDAD